MKRALLTLFCTLSALAQWPTDPAQNLLICDHAGEQALPKIAALSEGGCYVAWQDLASGNYDIYLQRLDANGVPQWDDPCGILISDHPQDTWLTDWDVAADVSDNCILAINDIRSGSDRDITVYSIGPMQEFLWGADGIALSNNDGFEPDPQIEPMDNGDIVFAWQEETNIHLRRLDAQGADVWDPPVITFTQTNGVSIPRLAEADSGAVVLSYLAQQGTSFMSPRYLYLRKYDVSGSALWNPSGVPIMTISGIGIQMRPDVLHDGVGGAYSYWYDARGNVHHVYAQHVNAEGNVEWTANGVQCDLTVSELQMSPSAVNTGLGIVLFYQTANSAQSFGGLEAQYLNLNGQYNWPSGGVTISPLLPDEHVFNVKAFVQNGNYAVFYSQYAFGSAVNTLLRASQLGEAGQFTWSPAVSDLCDVASEKGRPNACINSLHQILAAWPDSRAAVMDIYVQNVNSSGSLGPLGSLPPAIRFTHPPNDTTYREPTVLIGFEVENFIIAEEGGDGHAIMIVEPPRFGMPMHFDLFNTDPVEVPFDTPGVHHFEIMLVDNDGNPLNPLVMDSLNIGYVPPSITITWPTTPLDTFFWSNDFYPYIHFEVEDFVVADSGGDGRIHLFVRDLWRGIEESSVHVVEDSIEAPVWYFTTNQVVLSLVDYDGNQLAPPQADTVYIRAWQVSADPIPDLLPHEFAIASTYPNPFNATTIIEYAVPTPAHVSLNVYDITGRNVRTLFDAPQSAGLHRLNFTADDLPSGLYFVRLSAGSVTDTRKIVLLK